MKAWIKLYTEIVHDPKMGRLTDRQHRVCINLFALAGQVDDDGLLPPLEDIAWHLRTRPARLQRDMQRLAELGILCLDGEQWCVAHFAERQACPPSAEGAAVRRRVQEHRQRLQAAGQPPPAAPPEQPPARGV